jgi:hypothetical protein
LANIQESSKVVQGSRFRLEFEWFKGSRFRRAGEGFKVQDIGLRSKGSRWFKVIQEVQGSPPQPGPPRAERFKV